ncbi:MAG: glycosyltransferase [Chthoniobacterales bacterium]
MSDFLRIAIVHYHLRAGGVTRVISHAAKALIAAGHEVVVLTGEVPSDFVVPKEMHLKILPGLNYSLEYSAALVDQLVSQVHGAALEIFGEMPDVWHFHNHTLGKNMNLPHLVRRWAESDLPMVLQIHDFAENGRPANYRALLETAAAGSLSELAQILYPHSSRIRYAVLNPRDLEILRSVGANVSILPNPVELDSVFAPQNSVSFLLYPCRPIRRKNIGEAILWSLFLEEGSKLVFPVAPHNAADRAVYDQWRLLADKFDLPVEFEVIPRLAENLEALMAISQGILTTSVMEGFGMAFLEPYLAGKPLMGRNLPSITANLSSDGIDLSHLYIKLPIPVEWIGHERLRHLFLAAIPVLEKSYGIVISPTHREQTWIDLVSQDTIDFGNLCEDLQQEIITMLCSEPEKKKQISQSLQANPGAVDTSADAIREKYSPARYAERVLKIYRDVISSPPSEVESLDAAQILENNVHQSLHLILRTAAEADA